MATTAPVEIPKRRLPRVGGRIVQTPELGPVEIVVSTGGGEDVVVSTGGGEDGGGRDEPAAHATRSKATAPIRIHPRNEHPLICRHWSFLT
jgi:hypothetical protein